MKRTALKSKTPLKRKTALRARAVTKKRRRKPKPVISIVSGLPYKVLRDGREICRKGSAGLAEYKRRRDVMYDRDNGVCCVCGRFIPKGQETFEHKNGRGLGGNRRDDRISMNGVSHWLCNSKRGGGRWAA